MEVSAQEIRALRAVYKKAEDAIHSLGIESSGVDTAAINELRYAGNHLLHALDTANKEEASDQMERATRHCERALYDAYDGAIYYQLDQFRVFREDYRMVVITDLVPDYISIVERMNAARKTLEDARMNTADRGAYYEQAEQQYSSMAADMERLAAARDELNKKVQEKSAGNRRWLAMTLIALTSAIAAAALTWLRMSRSG